ncbi:uncharacterized protein LOC120338944 [Styela clava]
MWVEVAQRKEDWEEFFEICGREFVDSAFARRYLPDIEKRKLLMPLYFRYLYESRYSEDQGMLFLVKTKNEKIKTSIVAGWLAICDFSPRQADITKMVEVYKEGTDLLMKVEEWRAKNIHQVIENAAEDLNMKAIYGSRMVVVKAYAGQNILKRHSDEMLHLCSKETKKRYGNNTSFFLYWTSLENKLIGQTYRIAHLHYNYQPGLKCSEDSSAKREIEISCHFVMADLEMVEKLRQYFSLLNKL